MIGVLVMFGLHDANCKARGTHGSEVFWSGRFSQGKAATGFGALSFVTEKIYGGLSAWRRFVCLERPCGPGVVFGLITYYKFTVFWRDFFSCFRNKDAETYSGSNKGRQQCPGVKF